MRFLFAVVWLLLTSLPSLALGQTPPTSPPSPPSSRPLSPDATPALSPKTATLDKTSTPAKPDARDKTSTPAKTSHPLSPSPRSSSPKKAVSSSAAHATHATHATHAAHAAHPTPAVPHPAWILFFVLLLLAIAVFPLLNEHWWEHNTNKSLVAGILGAPVFFYYLMTSAHPLIHAAEEYFSFIVLLWALFTISGGIVIRGNFLATPRVNTAFLAIGAILANFFGTTGAAMLLIRPLLRTNQERKFKKHIIIFFIFLVANIGGTLTPLGDPPLFLGFLRGVPFAWTLTLWKVWLFQVILLLVIFYIWDTIAYNKESLASHKKDEAHRVDFAMDGKINFLFIAGVLLATLASKELHHFGQAIGFSWGEGSPWREIIMIAMGLLSLRLSRKEDREANHFNFAPIIEVAVLFAAIFITMIPALAWLGANGKSLGVTKAWHFLWATGVLSSFLDNAPTYLVFFSAAQGLSDAPTAALLIQKASHLLAAISIGAVFMGANTYIGNAPNFMVKVISDTAPGEMRVKMPSFFGYMAYSGGILIPTFILVTFLFFR